jgi:hypothetical protein
MPMTRPPGPTEQAERLTRLRDRRSISQDEYDQQMAELSRQTTESDEKYVRAQAAARKTQADDTGTGQVG